MLREGDYQLLLPEDQRLFTYLRQDNDRRWIVLANLSEEMIELSGLLELPNINSQKVIISNYSDRHQLMDLIRPYEAFIIEI